MKNRSLKADFRSMEQHPPFENFRPLAEQQQQAASLPLIPNSGTAAGLAVATAVKPSGTVGQIAVDLLNNKNTVDDRKIVIFAATPTSPARVLMFPSATPAADIFGGETLVTTVTRDDPTKETSAHTAAPEAGLAADPVNVAVVAALAASKPKRSLSSLINALVDALAADEALDALPVGIVFDQDGNGEVEVYKGVGLGIADASDEVGDVMQEAAAPAVTNPLW